MKKFFVEITVTVSRSVLVSADNKEEAEEMARQGKGETQEESEDSYEVNNVEDYDE